MIRFVSDSSCDIPAVDGVSTCSVPLSIYSADFSYTDDQDIDIHGMLDTLSAYNSRSYTSCPCIDAWLQAYEGADTIYVVTITSGLSGSYNAAMAAREVFLQAHPHAKIRVFDSLSAGPEPRLLLEKLMELSALGLAFDTVCKIAETYMKSTRLFFALKSLHNMAQNGRVSKVACTAVGVLNLSVIGTASLEGTLEPVAKARGEKRTLAKLVEEIEAAGYRGGKIRISQIENPELGEKLREALLAKYPHGDIQVYAANGLCSYYAERGGLMIGIEGAVRQEAASAPVYRAAML